MVCDGILFGMGNPLLDISAVADQDLLDKGQMGVYVDRAEKSKEQKIPNGKDQGKSKKKHNGENEVQVENGDVATSCCEGANGVSCCKDGSLEVKERKGWVRVQAGWQSDVLTAVGVVGAVATIAVAYSFYRRSG